MPPTVIPLELLLMIAHHMRDDDGELRYADFNSFLQVNRAVYACLNRDLWQEAAEHKASTQRVLTHLIKTNDLARVKFFLELGADADTRLPAIEVPGLRAATLDRYTALMVATYSDNLPLARLLLEKGAKVQYTGCRFPNEIWSPIHLARSAEMAQLLLDHSADPNWLDGLPRQPLHWYAIRNDIPAMRTILQHGAEVNPIVTFDTPLHEAAQRSLDAVKLLLEYGADMDVRDPEGSTPLHLAARAGIIDVVEFLVARSPKAMRSRDIYFDTPLHLAAAMQSTEVVRFLVERWPEGKEALDNDERTPLSRFEENSRGMLRIVDKEKEEMIALLGGPHSEANND